MDKLTGLTVYFLSNPYGSAVMYETFFGLKERPFNLTPDPKYLYLSDKHKEAFAHLLYGIKNRSGFVMITGEIGTGKTTLCRNLLNQLDSGAEVAFIFNPFLEPLELLKKINQEFGIEPCADTVLGLTEELNKHLLLSAAHGKNCVLVIDEAQNLSPRVLEQIRLLSNIETDSEKLLQIILIGQPELAEKLQLTELRQLNQRITARYHLKSLNATETLEYIAYRIYVAGGKKRVDFTRPAAKLVYKLSGGVPRMINALCDRALLIGYTREQRVVTAREVRHAMQEIRGEKVVAPKNTSVNWRRWLPAPSMAALLIIALVLTHYLVNPLDRFAHELRLFNALIAGDMNAAGTSSTGRESSLVTADSITHPDRYKTAEGDRPRRVLNVVMERLDASRVNGQEQFLAPVMKTVNPETALKAGIDHLTALWKRALVETYPGERTADALVAFFDSQGLACERLRAALDQIYRINLPGLARMKFGDEEFWVGTVRMDDRTVTLLAENNRRATVSYDEFERHYRSEFLVPWQDPLPESPIIAPGQRGPKVVALKEKLCNLGRLSSENTTDIYDRETEAAVYALQKETGLKADGMTGRQMRLALSSLEPGNPVLHRTGWQTATFEEKKNASIPAQPPAPKKTPVAAVPRVKSQSRPEPAPLPSAAKKVSPQKPDDFEVIEKVPVEAETSPDSQLPPITGMATTLEHADAAGHGAGATGVLLKSGAPFSAFLTKALASDETPTTDDGQDAGASNGAESLMQVRELPGPEQSSGPNPLESKKSVLTEPVPGSMPLVPHTEKAS